MIQRIQSLFLLIALGILSMIWVFPMLSYTVADLTTQIFPFHTEVSGVSPDSYIPYLKEDMALMVGVFALVTSLTILIQIFLFKDRKKQMKLGRINLILLVVTVGLSNAFAFMAGGFDEVGLSSLVSVGMGGVFPLIALIPVFLANRAIKKDEDLIRSVDRLR